MKIIRESLNRLDLMGIDNNDYYDLRNLYEAVEHKMTPQEKQELRKLIDVTDDPKTISAYLNSKDESLELTEADVILSKADMVNPDKMPNLKGMAQKVYKDEQENKKKVELRAKAKTVLKNINDELTTLNSDKPSDILQVYFEHLVPSNGIANTVAGEIVRAMMRLLYRDYNDGDVFYEGYGFETCGATAGFLADKLDLYRDFNSIAMKGMYNDSYTEALETITSKVITYLNEHEELFATPNKENMLNGPTDWLEEYAYKYEFGIDVPENVNYEDFVDFINSVLNNDTEFRNAYVNTSIRDFVNIEGLSKDGYETLEQFMNDWINEWIKENYPE